MIQTLPTLVQTVGTVLGSALVASLVFWVAKRRGTNEPIKPEKTAITIGVAFVISVALLVTGRATSQDQLLAQLAPLVGPASVWVQEGIQRYQRTGGGDTSDHGDDGGFAFDGEEPDPEPTPEPTPADTPTDDDARALATARAKTHIQDARYHVLQRVGGRLPSVDGSGRQGIVALRAQLTDEADRYPRDVLDAFDAIESGGDTATTATTDDDPDDVFQLTGPDST